MWFRAIVEGDYGHVEKPQNFTGGQGHGTMALDPELMKELAQSGAEFTADEVVFLSKNTEGKLLWLEEGSDSAGLKHIAARHADDFTAKGISDIPQFLYTTVQSKPQKVGIGAKGQYAEYLVNGSRYRVAYGWNGFIVSFFPID